VEYTRRVFHTQGPDFLLEEMMEELKSKLTELQERIEEIQVRL
jgi:hypothetical protein